jgi:hypothetical protein
VLLANTVFATRVESPCSTAGTLVVTEGLLTPPTLAAPQVIVPTGPLAEYAHSFAVFANTSPVSRWLVS